MFSELCTVNCWCDKNQQDAIFTFSLFDDEQ